jgi:hypothetical protein
MSYSVKIIHSGVTVAFILLVSGLFFFNASSVSAGTCAGGGYDPFGTCVCPSGTSLVGGDSGDCVGGAPNPSSVGGSDAPNPSSVGGLSVGKITNPLQSQTIPAFLFKIIDVLLIFALPLIILYIMYAGYLFVTAAGNAEKVSGAKSALLWSVVGGVIVLGARLIISVIEGTIKAF